MVQKKIKTAVKKTVAGEKTTAAAKKMKLTPAAPEASEEQIAKKTAAVKEKPVKKAAAKAAPKKKAPAEKVKPAHEAKPAEQSAPAQSAAKPEVKVPAHAAEKPVVHEKPAAPTAVTHEKPKPKIKKPVDSAAVFSAPVHIAKPKLAEVKPEHKPEEKHKAPEKAVQPAPAAAETPAKIQEPAAAAQVSRSVETKPVQEPPKILGEIKINELTTIKELSDKMNHKPGELLLKLLSLGTRATINQRLDKDIAELLAHEFKYTVKYISVYAEDTQIEEDDAPSTLKARPPVVTIMGHVDHGKTSLLDAVRLTDVVAGEAGGITQHIGAYKVKTKKGEIAFLDTPGHEAFTAMRSRGAKATDLVVLVVSAGDGVMPQTVEAIDHARAANVPIIVAINKIDLPTANPQQTRQELSKYNLMPEDWGGDTIMVEVSAKKKINIENLLEMILLKAEMMELKANPDRLAQGLVIEAKLDSKKGPIATLLVQNGTLKVGDNIVVGTTYGKIRAMQDEHGKRIEVAPPSTPVEILGMNIPPQAGDKFFAVEQEYQAREIADSRMNRAREEALKPRHHLSLEDISAGKTKDLRIVLKTDVQGSLGALSDSLERLSTNEINLKIIHSGAGSITESDVTLAAASDAMIMGFNIRPDSSVERFSEREGVNIRVYRIIYELIADVKAAMEGMLEPTIKETSSGKAQVKQVFKVSKAGTIAGCMVTEGKILRNCKVRLVRDNVIVYEGSIASLHRFKDDVKDVEKGFECGIGLENFADIKPGDVMEAFTQEKIARKL